MASRSAGRLCRRWFNASSAACACGIEVSACATASKHAFLPSWYWRPCELLRVSVHATALNVSASQLVRILPSASRCTCATRTWSKVARLWRSCTTIIAMLRATSATNPMGSSLNRRCRVMARFPTRPGLLDRDLGDERAAEVALGLLEAVLSVAGDASRGELHRVVAHHRVAVALHDGIEPAA